MYMYCKYTHKKYSLILFIGHYTVFHVLLHSSDANTELIPLKIHRFLTNYYYLFLIYTYIHLCLMWSKQQPTDVRCLDWDEWEKSSLKKDIAPDNFFFSHTVFKGRTKTLYYKVASLLKSHTVHTVKLNENILLKTHPNFLWCTL